MDNTGVARLQQEADLLRERCERQEALLREQRRKNRQLHEEVRTLSTTLSDIYASEGWKLLTAYYFVRNSLLPRGSRRHEGLKKIVNWLRLKKEDGVVGAPTRKRYLRTTPTSFEPFAFPRFARPRVSIIVPAYNGWEMNYLCLRSIWEHTDGVPYEVIFADDQSTDETRHVGQYIQNLRHIRPEANLGFLRNCNHAAGLAKGDYLHFLNNDTEVTPEWLSTLVELLDKDPSIGMAGSKLIYPDGRLQEAGGIIWKDASASNYGNGGDPEAPEFNYVKEVDYISGASILVRRDLWERLGGFDEYYLPAYCEDTDLAFQVRQEGFKVVYQPASEVIHYEGFSHGSDADVRGGAPVVKLYQQVNAAKLARRWQPVLEHQFAHGIHPFWARDRSRHRPTILVIDHYVPRFDKDAGSRTTFQYLTLLASLGMNVKFLGDDFYRYEPYTRALQQKGIEVLYGSHYQQHWLSWIKDNEGYIDYVLLNRPHIAVKYIASLRANLHARMLYYTHDLHYVRKQMEYEVTRDPQALASALDWKKTEYGIFAASDVVLTPTGKEQEIIRGDFPALPIEVMPAFFYDTIAEPVTHFDDRKDLLFVGGFDHSPNVDAVLWFASAVLPLIRENNPDIRLIVVGSNTPEAITALEGPGISVRGFVTDEELNLLYTQVRLAVIPLRFGAGLKGKTVEALVRGLPIVSTSFGIEGMPGISAIAPPADTTEGFVRAVLDLYGNTARLAAASAGAVAYAREHFTKAVAADFFKKLFNL